MKKTEIEQILKQGSVKQKIKLYLTEMALFNVEINTFTLEVKKEGLSIKSPILTEKERDLLWSSIKEPKDIEYYEKLRTLNKVFLYFKDKLSIENMRLRAYFFFLLSFVSNQVAREDNAEVINDLLNLYPDKKSREVAYKLALEKTKVWGGQTYQEKGYPKYIEIEERHYLNFISPHIEEVNKTAKGAKELIGMFKHILSKELPLQPYKDWVKKEEDITIDTINQIYNIFTGGESGEPGSLKILKYDEIETEITQEDIEDFKNSVL